MQSSQSRNQSYRSQLFKIYLLTLPIYYPAKIHMDSLVLEEDSDNFYS